MKNGPDEGEARPGEKPQPDGDRAVSKPVWRKSSRSGSGAGGGQDCVEVAALAEGRGIRDSKAPEAGHLTLTPGSFSQLIACVKRDDLNI
ncbi:DUF397 domain-containing protein [Actinomadura sp. NTSP31]|uniref:DUF397 domain-containing protein n=1 Tax=Actinomadura sp. NTSP31 TaxID=1735447 RepID=UPI0035C058E0